MALLSAGIERLSVSPEPLMQERIKRLADELIASLPDAGQLSDQHQRRMIARYAAVLEGNFIYWMTAALLSVKSEEARAIVLENLTEEVRDCHPGMLRRFATAADALPTDEDSREVSKALANVRLFMGRLEAVPIIVTMAFFEGFIQQFMAYLADLAKRQGSTEMEYTDVHGICDITHTEELYRALAAETAVNPPGPTTNVFEGVELLNTLLESIVHGASLQSQPKVAQAACSSMSA